MKQKDIEYLIKIRNDKDIITLYPNAKLVQQTVQQLFYNIKPNVWINCLYNIDDEGVHISLESIYSGNENKEDYKYIWKYKKNKI
jgi:hypothetical protein